VEAVDMLEDRDKFAKLMNEMAYHIHSFSFQD